ncbi:MAG: hypothetical protein V1789_03365 [PVC group bacterium]
MMKKNRLLPVAAFAFAALFASTGLSQESAGGDIDQGYLILKEAYQAREAGDDVLAREKMAQALAVFRRAAAGSAPALARPETEYLLEETPRGLNLIENKTLFRIEFTVDPEARSRSAKEREDLIRQQQLIIQKLIELTRDNAELKEIVARVESNTKETDTISDMVGEIRDETAEIAGLGGRIDDIKDNTDNIVDSVDKLESDAGDAGAVEDIADDVSDIRDEMDILKDILNIVEEIKDDTDNIKDLEGKIEDVKDAVEKVGDGGD